MFRALVVLFPIVSAAWAANRDVCPTCTHQTIGAAVAAAQSGDTVRVVSGTYPEHFDIQKTNWSIRIEGGYTSDFSARTGETSLLGLRVTYFNSGSVELDGLTLTGSSFQGIYIDSADTDVIVNNCKIHHNSYDGIFVRASGEIQITNNQIYSNGTYSGLWLFRAVASGQATVTGNTIHSNNCSSCWGINASFVTSDDIFNNNVVYGNEGGVQLNINGSAQSPDISYNRVYSNLTTGVYVSSGTVSFHHNIIYDNGTVGAYFYSSGSATVTNNLFATTGNGPGLSFAYGSGAPYVTNNIFYNNFRGLVIGAPSGWGGVGSVPGDLSYNVFYGNTYGQLVHNTLAPEYSFSAEEPGVWGDINKMAWSDSNVVLDPHFVDPENFDFRLESDSFLIDQGKPSSGYSAEPARNGARVNIGPFGNTAQAETSQPLPTISGLSAAQSGNTVEINFSVGSGLSDYWLSAYYLSGSSFVLIPATAISGGDYVIGARTGRVRGSGPKSLTWSNLSSYLSSYPATSRIKLIIEHGNSTSEIQSAQFQIQDPDATPTATPTSTPTAVATSTPTVIPTATPTAEPTRMPETNTPEPTRTAVVENPGNDQETAPPSIRALSATVRTRSNLILPIEVSDPDSASLRIRIWLKRSGKILSVHGQNDISASAQRTRMNLDLGEMSLRSGGYQYCIRATDGDGNKSEERCAKLVVRAR